VIHQPPRRGDDDIDAGLERTFLRAHFDASVDRGARDGRVVREAVDLVFDLHGELARRREHEHARFGSAKGLRYRFGRRSSRVHSRFPRIPSAGL